MKKVLSFVLTAVIAVGFTGWTALSTQAATTYTAAQVAQHNTAADCWLIISGQVYDVTNFIPIHPGGNAIIPYCGADATAIFDSIHGTTGTAASLLPTYLIGSLATALTAPTNLAGTPAVSSVALSWTASMGGVTPLTYSVMRDGTSVGTTSATTFTDTGLTASTTYTYVVQAIDGATPTAETAASAQISVTTLTSDVTALTAPINLTGTPTQSSVVLKWTASMGGVAPITYTIIKNGVVVGSTTATTFTNTGLAASTTYTYVIKAIDSATPTAGTASSAQISVTTLKVTTVGGGDDQNENENEHTSTSTPPTGGHGDDDGGATGSTSSGGQTGSGTSYEGHYGSSTNNATPTTRSSSGRHGGDN